MNSFFFIKSFFIGLLTGLAFAFLGVIGLVYLFNNSFGNRDGEQAAGFLLLYFFIVAAILFVMGFLAGLYWSKK